LRIFWKFLPDFVNFFVFLLKTDRRVESFYINPFSSGSVLHQEIKKAGGIFPADP